MSPVTGGWLTARHRHFEGAQTPTRASTAGALARWQPRRPNSKEIWGTDATLFCLTGPGEENKSQQIIKGRCAQGLQRAVCDFHSFET